VSDKEKIKSLRSHVHVLSLSATPIPRSLNLALSGIRQISLLREAPTGRKSIETLVARFDEGVIQEAGMREFARNGQVFFIHNRVATIEVFQKQLQKLFPDKKIIITHGQMDGEELESRILDFKHKKYDILLSTTVIENGIDFPNVNTIFINECQNFGISQIHQLRGRVGRSERQ
jgi:transcription-repair coupling factor (superfamily II helicase)